MGAGGGRAHRSQPGHGQLRRAALLTSHVLPFVCTFEEIFRLQWPEQKARDVIFCKTGLRNPQHFRSIKTNEDMACFEEEIAGWS